LGVYSSFLINKICCCSKKRFGTTLVSRRAHYDVILLVQQQGENIMACSAEYFLRDVLLSFLVLLYSSETLPEVCWEDIM
jgi:hypothetical protein